MTVNTIIPSMVQAPSMCWNTGIGAGVRVGIEDNIWYDINRTMLARNADLIRRIHNLAKANLRKVMSPNEFRNLLDLENGAGRYGRKVGQPKLRSMEESFYSQLSN